MAWVKYTDTFATHPIVLAVLEHPESDARSVNEVAGFITRCATEAGQHFTDYVFSYGTAITMAGGDRDYADRLMVMAQFAGYGVFELDEQTGRRRFRLVDDPEFIHMITAGEKAWNDQRKADNGNPQIIVPARLRDGDVCRYCYNVVNFNARKGKLRGTYDHRPPGEPSSWETTVVCCGECNQVRGDRPLEVADLERPLQPVLVEPYYHASTRAWLQGYTQILRQHGMVPPPPAPDQKNLISGRPVPGAQAAPTGRRATAQVPTPGSSAGSAPTGAPRSATAAAGTARPTAVRPAAPTPTKAHVGPVQAVPADPGRSRQNPGLQDLETPGRVGSGRDGSPLVSPLPGEGTDQTRRRRRGKRGGRNKAGAGVRVEDPPAWVTEEIEEGAA